jgi:hypothetical protein
MKIRFDTFFFFFGKNIALRKLGNNINKLHASTGQRNKRKVFSTTNWDRRRGEVGGNAAREDSCRGPICHMVGAEVSTSVNFSGLPI